jgi:hypothetical protein
MSLQYATHLVFHAWIMYTYYMGWGMVYYGGLKAVNTIASGSSWSTVPFLWSNVSSVCVRIGIVRLMEIMVWECSVYDQLCSRLLSWCRVFRCYWLCCGSSQSEMSMLVVTSPTMRHTIVQRTCIITDRESSSFTTLPNCKLQCLSKL